MLPPPSSQSQQSILASSEKLLQSVHPETRSPSSYHLTIAEVWSIFVCTIHIFCWRTYWFGWDGSFIFLVSSSSFLASLLFPARLCELSANLVSSDVWGAPACTDPKMQTPSRKWLANFSLSPLIQFSSWCFASIMCAFCSCYRFLSWERLLSLRLKLIYIYASDNKIICSSEIDFLWKIVVIFCWGCKRIFLFIKDLPLFLKKEFIDTG